MGGIARDGKTESLSEKGMKRGGEKPMRKITDRTG